MAGAQAHGVQALHDGGRGQPGGVLLKDIPDCLGTCGLDDVVFAGVHGEAQRAGAAQGFAFKGGFPHTAAGFFGQLGAVILSQSFHQALNDDALGTGDVALGGIEDLHTVVPELFLIDGAVVAVAGQTVGFPADHGVKDVRGAVGHQLLEGGAVIGFAADVAVYILAQDGHAVGAGVGLAVPALALDALLGLAAAARVAVVSHQARCIGCSGFFAGHDNTSFRAVAHMQGVWYTDPCKHKILFVRFCAALHVSPALHRTSAGVFACPYPKSVLCCKGRRRMERNLLVFLSLPFDDGATPSGWKRLEGVVRL